MVDIHEMARPSVEPFVLIVDNTPNWPEAVGITLKSARVESARVKYDVVDTVSAAVERLGNDDEPRVTGVITDALEGGYPDVVEAAVSIGALVALMTRSSTTAAKAGSMGVPAFLRVHFENATATDATRRTNLEELVRTVVPQAIFKKR